MASAAPSPSLEAVLCEAVRKYDKALGKPSCDSQFNHPQTIQTVNRGVVEHSGLIIPKTQSVPSLKPVPLSPESFTSSLDSPKSVYDSPIAHTGAKSPLNSPKATAGKSRTKRKHKNAIQIVVKNLDEFRSLVEQYTAKPKPHEPSQHLWDYPLPSSGSELLPDLPGLCHASELGNNPNFLSHFDNNFGFNVTPPPPPDIFKLQTS